MKNYLLFFFSDYYPRGGMEDFIADFDTIEEAISHLDFIIEKLVSEKRYESSIEVMENNSAHIWDNSQRKNIWESFIIKAYKL